MSVSALYPAGVNHALFLQLTPTVGLTASCTTRIYPKAEVTNNRMLRGKTMRNGGGIARRGRPYQALNNTREEIYHATNPLSSNVH
jgi:hypothetical protein